MKPSMPSLAKGSPSTGDGISTEEGRVDHLSLQLCGVVPHKTSPSSRFRGASSSVTNPCLALPAIELTVEQVPTGDVTFTSDLSAGPAPEDMSCDVSDISDGESFETRSSSEGPSSSSSITESRRNVFIDRTISWIISWIDSKLAILVFQRRGAYEENEPRESAKPGAKSYAAGRRLTEGKREGYKGGGRCSDNEDSDSEDLLPTPSQGSADGGREKIIEFACPFLKHDPGKYQQIRSCSAAGWKAVFRLKEHLYRCHLLPPFRCARCFMIFKSSDQLLEHSRAKSACQVVHDEAEQEGISQAQLMKLKSRKRNRDASSEHDKWIHVYKILFPNDYIIPSPYFQHSDPEKGQESLLKDLREHVSRELPRLLRPQLEESVDATIREALGPDMLEGLVRNIFAQVLSTFPQKRRKTAKDQLGETGMEMTSSTVPRLETLRNDGLSPRKVPTFGTKEDVSAAWILSHQPEIEQPEIDRQARHHIDNEPLSWQMWCQESTQAEMEPGPSTYLSRDHSSYFPPVTTIDTPGAPKLSDFFGFEDLYDEYASWLGQSDEMSSRADSGYFSLQLDDVAGKGKGKGVEREPRQ